MTEADRKVSDQLVVLIQIIFGFVLATGVDQRIVGPPRH
jgi:hypothetical protein